MLEVLDPEQNLAFRDYYLDLPFDISQVLFIVTANTLETIPRPLLDRMEVIHIAGYTTQEKLAIGKKYLVPKSLKKHGLDRKGSPIPPRILQDIAESYAREAACGIMRIARPHPPQGRARDTRARSGPAGEDHPEKMIEYLGQPIFHEDEVLRADRPGMAIGLAWTSMGGDTLVIEAVSYPGKGELKLTGKLGEVMQESANIALTHLKSIASGHGIESSWFETHAIHLHVPEGATPKDGPSAGVTMASAH